MLYEQPRRLSKIYIRSICQPDVIRGLSLSGEADKVEIIDVTCHNTSSYLGLPDALPVGGFRTKHLSMKNLRGELDSLQDSFSPNVLQSLELENVAVSDPNQLAPLFSKFGRHLTYLKLNLVSLRSDQDPG